MAELSIEPFVASRADHRPIPPPSETRRLAVAEAYAVQDRLRQALVASGERVIGWKAGFTNRTTQKMFEAEEPVGAFLLASGVFASGAEVPCSRFVGVVVEAEVAFVMKHELAGPGVTPPRALQAVDGRVA